MPRSPHQLHAELNATIARNRAKKQLQIRELARSGRVVMSFPVPMAPSEHAAMDDMILCFIAQQRVFIRFTDEGACKLVEIIDALPIPFFQICPPDDGQEGLDRASQIHP